MMRVLGAGGVGRLSQIWRTRLGDALGVREGAVVGPVVGLRDGDVEGSRVGACGKTFRSMVSALQGCPSLCWSGGRAFGEKASPKTYPARRVAGRP
jgi:hypothetical protein